MIESLTSSSTSPDNKIFVTEKLQLEFLVKENETDQFKSIPMILAKPLMEVPDVPEKPTYLVEVNKVGFLAYICILFFLLSQILAFQQMF